MNNISLYDRRKIQSILFLSKNLSHLLSSHWKIRAQKAALGMSSTSSKYEQMKTAVVLVKDVHIPPASTFY